MDIRQFFLKSHIFIITGKGGTGKTVSSLALAKLASEQGLKTLLVTLETDSHIFSFFEIEDPPINSSLEVHNNLSLRLITPEEALLEYLLEHGLGKISRKLISTNTIDVIANAIPGIQEILVLGRLKRFERDRLADVIILDAPATGHAVTLLTSPAGLTFAARGGALKKQADEVDEMLKDHSRCQVILVTIPEETPVNEVIDAAYAVEEKTDVALGPMIINQMYTNLEGLDINPIEASLEAGAPAIDTKTEALLLQANRFRMGKIEAQNELLKKLDEKIALPKIYLPLISEENLGQDFIALLSKEIGAQITSMYDFEIDNP